MLQINWDKEVFISENINEIYSNFVSTLNNCIDKHIPKKTITVRPRDKVFMNGTIRQLMRKRNRTHYKAKITNNPQTILNTGIHIDILEIELLMKLEKHVNNYNKNYHL